jgi:hypothetical protein
MDERFEPRRNVPTTQNFERMFAKHHRDENIEKEIELKVEKEASLSVSQALEKAKSLVDGTVLSQESYHDILNQLEDKNRYPFTVSLVEHEIRIAQKEAQSVAGDEQEYMQTLSEIRTAGHPTHLGWEGLMAEWGYQLGRSAQKVYSDLLDVGALERDVFQAIRTAYQGTGLTLSRDVSRMGAVNIIDEISGPQGGELTFPSEFPAGEIPSNESGTSEHDFPGTRRVEGKKAQAPTHFEDIASPQERAEYQRLIDGEEYDAAWELLKEVTQTAGERDAEIGNSLIDLTTEKWAANDQVSKTGAYNQKAFLTLEEIDAGLVPCRKKK